MFNRKILQNAKLPFKKINKPFIPKLIATDLIAVKPLSIKLNKLKPAQSDKQKLRESRINKLRQLDGKKPNIKLPNDIKIWDPNSFYYV